MTGFLAMRFILRLTMRFIFINHILQNKSKIILDFSQWYTIPNTRFWSNQSICKIWSCYVQQFRRICIYKKVHYFTFDLDLRSRTDTKLFFAVYPPAKFEVAMSDSLGGNAFTRKYIIWPWPQGKGGQGHMKCCPELSTSCDLCTSKVWCCYISWLRRCIYKKIHNLTLTLGSGSVTRNVAQYPWHHVTYAPAKFDVATSHG